jgi:hypothetical protein
VMQRDGRTTSCRRRRPRCWVAFRQQRSRHTHR